MERGRKTLRSTGRGRMGEELVMDLSVESAVWRDSNCDPREVGDGEFSGVEAGG